MKANYVSRHLHTIVRSHPGKGVVMTSYVPFSPANKPYGGPVKWSVSHTKGDTVRVWSVGTREEALTLYSALTVPTD